MKLIDKDALVAEIEELKTAIDIKLRSSNDSAYWKAQSLICERLESKVNSLEVKEIDFDKPLGEVKIHTSMESGSLDEVIVTTKYKAQKGEKV